MKKEKVVYETLDLFPVPMIRVKYPKAQSLRKIIKPIFYDMENYDKTNFKYSANSHTSYATNLAGYGAKDKPNYSSALESTHWAGHELLSAIPELKDLRNFILQAGIQANRFIGIDRNVESLMFQGSWFSINRKYGYHGYHSHMPGLWSGVYYVQAVNEDSAITFLDVNKKHNWPTAYSTFNDNNYCSPSCSIPPETGMLIIFPSWLEHGVEQQMDDRERITISFNLNPKPSTEQMQTQKERVEALS